MKTTKASPVYCGSKQGTHIVVGDAMGATMLAFDCTLSEAIDEYDERFGERVESDDPALADYEPTAAHIAEAMAEDDDPTALQRARYFAALDSGDVRVNDGGTTVWVDPHEWAREFTDVRAAMRCFLGIPD